MSDTDQLRARATRLFALALKARDEGKTAYADELTKLASEAFDQATEIAIVSITSMGERDPTTIKDRALNAVGARRFGANAA